MRCRSRIVLTLIGAVSLSAANGAFRTVQAADPDSGKSVFRSQCALCHATQAGRNMIGPSLAGVVGRRTGSEAGYSYSVANKNANITWTPGELDRYLQSPRSVIPGTKMPYAGLSDPTKRSDLIAYLETLR
jgi:cytochrome c